MENKQIVKEYMLEDIIAKSIQVPGVKVDRKKFLAEEFSSYCESLDELINKGPIEMGMDQKTLDIIASKLIFKRTSQSSIASFVTGLPGGLAMAATIPADVLQFFAMALKLAQELSYIYGGSDIWIDGAVDDEKVRDQLILYSGVMFGVSGAVSGVRVLSTQLAKTTMKKLPQKALTKTIWYPIIKKISSQIGIKMTKTTLANGVSKAVPVVGGVISGSLNFASMMPAAKRLKAALEESCFNYSDEKYNEDIQTLLEVNEDQTEDENKFIPKEKLLEGLDFTKNSFNSLKSKIKIGKNNSKEEVKDPYEEIKKLKELLDMDIISEEEFAMKKKELLNL